MVGPEVNAHPIRLVVNYWEIPQSSLGARLEELLRNGISHVATFLPWQAVESDISHSLSRFLQAVSEREMSVSLIASPEVGVHYPNSGLPKDIFNKHDPAARHSRGGAVGVHLAPNSFALPSLLSSEFSKRYQNYLSRLDNLLGDMGRLQSQLLDEATVVLTGSYWKYMRAPQDSSMSIFGSICGDFSPSASLNFRQKVEQFYSQKEFLDPNPMAAQRWKTKNMEDINRRWFYQSCEDVFRARSSQFLTRKARVRRMKHIELFTPEADPSLAYSTFVQAVSGGRADFSRLNSIVDEACRRSSNFDGEALPPYMHWTGFGSFRTLNDSEKQFLILKSLLLTGSQGGGIYLDDREWFSLSPTFRNRAENLARSLGQRELKAQPQVLYLAPSLWSKVDPLWEEIQKKLPEDSRIVSSVDRVQRERDANLVLVDPSFVMTRDQVSKLTGWVSSPQGQGRILVMPRSQLYTEAAKAELEQVISKAERLDVNLGISYQLRTLGNGKLVIYDLPEGSENKESAWQIFLNSLFSLANITHFCSVSDGRLRILPLHLNSAGLGIFIVNPSGRAVTADLIFPSEVNISDLGSLFSASGLAPQDFSQKAPTDQVAASRYALEVPPYGVLPLGVAGLKMDEVRFEMHESQKAGDVTESLRSNVADAGVNELPGHSAGEDIGALWS